MKWIKKGLIYGPDGSSSWAKHSALTPTPLLLTEDIIRVYAGFRDDSGVSRIGYVDVDANDPSKVLKISNEPVLDVGIPGTFDDNGVILGDVVSDNGRLYMYYVGFQLVEKVKFLAFSGLAVSDNNGESFTKLSNAPILDRSDEGLYIRAVHSVVREGDVWKVWYAAGSDWTWINGIPYPKYHIRYIESEDGINFRNAGKLCINNEGNEYRIGRPRVYIHNDSYKMFYTKGTLNGDYILGYAESPDGISWKRMDDVVGITLSESGWDSKTLCYPSLLRYNNRIYMFYNGNDMGKNGFGYAVLEK